MGGTEDISRLLKTVRAQAMRLYRSIKQYNTHFWDLMINDEDVEGKTRPEYYSPGSEEEACLVIGHLDVAWASSPGETGMMYLMSMLR